MKRSLIICAFAVSTAFAACSSIGMGGDFLDIPNDISKIRELPGSQADAALNKYNSTNKNKEVEFYGVLYKVEKGANGKLNCYFFSTDYKSPENNTIAASTLTGATGNEAHNLVLKVEMAQDNFSEFPVVSNPFFFKTGATFVNLETGKEIADQEFDAFIEKTHAFKNYDGTKDYEGLRELLMYNLTRNFKAYFDDPLYTDEAAFLDSKGAFLGVIQKELDSGTLKAIKDLFQKGKISIMDAGGVIMKDKGIRVTKSTQGFFYVYKIKANYGEIRYALKGEVMNISGNRPVVTIKGNFTNGSIVDRIVLDKTAEGVLSKPATKTNSQELEKIVATENHFALNQAVFEDLPAGNYSTFSITYPDGSAHLCYFEIGEDQTRIIVVDRKQYEVQVESTNPDVTEATINAVNFVYPKFILKMKFGAPVDDRKNLQSFEVYTPEMKSIGVYDTSVESEPVLEPDSHREH